MRFFKIPKRILALFLCCVMAIGCAFSVSPSVYARSKNEINAQISELEQKSKELEKEIAALKSQKKEQNAIKAKIEAQIANTQAQINLCNSQISKFNNEIAANEAKIAEKEKEKEETVFLFKQRLRTIHMSNGSSTLQVLLGADSFADYLSLAQLTKVVSAHDNKIIEQLIALVDEINLAQQEINEKIAAQNDIKKTLAAKKSELDKQVSAVNAVIADINSDTSAAQKENKKTEADIKALYAELAPAINAATNVVYDGSAFTWPVPGHFGITSYYAARWGTWHYGIDISDGGIYNAPIVAVADGVIVRTNNSCSHNYRKYRSCGCGSGWGNYVMVDHGKDSSGNVYKSLCGHMTRTAVSVGQKVKKGQVIGYVGTTGYSTGYHCHFEIYLNGSRVDPLRYYKKVK